MYRFNYVFSSSRAADHFKNCPATPIIGKNKSKGSSKTASKIAGLSDTDTNLLAVAIQKKELPAQTRPKLHFWEKWRFALLKLKNQMELSYCEK